MGIKSLETNKCDLFHAVNLSWKGDRVSFSFLPSQANSTRMIIDGIIPYFRSIYGDEVLDFFDPDTILTKSDWEWDEVNNLVINPLSKDLVELDEVDMDYNFIPRTVNVCRGRGRGKKLYRFDHKKRNRVNRKSLGKSGNRIGRRLNINYW